MSKKKEIVLSTNKLFSTRVGMCSISMVLDVRHSKDKADHPLSLCFSINRKRIYHSLGERYTHEELARIFYATGQGERKGDSETNFEKKQRLSGVFDSYVKTIQQLNETEALTLDRISTALTGRAKSSSFVEEWEKVVEELRLKGKIGTATSYRCGLRCFLRLSGFTPFEGFTLSKEVIDRWIVAMTEKGISETTRGIYLRACRVIVNHCIDSGYMMQRNYMFGRGKKKVSIPNGKSRKDKYLDANQMTALFYHWKRRDLDLPLYQEGSKDTPAHAVRKEEGRELIYQSLGFFLLQYLCNGCNLIDLALLRYNQHYYDSNGRIFQFIRQKTQKEANKGEGVEVIIPVIEPLRELLDAYAAKPEPDALVFPFLLGDSVHKSAERQYAKVRQEGKNIGERMKKVALSLGWTVSPTGTWCRHSFATNLNMAGVPMAYISDAMGHNTGNSGMITKRYMAYPIEQSFKYNRLLLTYESKETLAASGREVLLKKLDRFSDEDLRDALVMLTERELERLKANI